jgi:ABC-2 type transport system permease protein
MAIIGIVYLIVVIQLAVVFLFGEGTADFLTTNSWKMIAPGIVMILFAALVAPDAIVRDQKNGMFSLYMSTPLTKPTYLAAKTLSVAGSVLLITFGPGLLYLLGKTMKGMGPDGVTQWFETFGRLLLACFLLSLFLCMFSLAFSCFTNRRAIASIVVLVAYIAPAVASAIINEETSIGKNILLLNPVETAYEFGARICNAQPLEEAFGDISTSFITMGFFAWLVASCSIIFFSYQRKSAI